MPADGATSFTEIELDPLEVQLDPTNPRIEDDLRSNDQGALLEVLVEHFKVEELALAIAVDGYVALDPLLGYEKGGKTFVREGNRRIAAAKLLKRPDLAPKRHYESFKFLADSLSPEAKQSLNKVKVLRFKNIENESLDTYLGFRHVTGPLPWDAEQKARFAAELIERHNWTYKDVSKRLGTNKKGVERMYIAHRLKVQAKELDVDGADRIKMGVLVRALQTSGVSEFLGVQYTGDPTTSEKPVPEAKKDELKDFILWVFGTAARAPVVGDSRKLTQFGKVLQSADGIVYLRDAEEPSLDAAVRKVGVDAAALAHLLLSAALRLEEAQPWITDHLETKSVTDAALRCTRRLISISKELPEVREELLKQLRP